MLHSSVRVRLGLESQTWYGITVSLNLKPATTYVNLVVCVSAHVRRIVHLIKLTSSLSLMIMACWGSKQSKAVIRPTLHKTLILA